jgi:uncharacterized iron-regulated membrane protein
MFFRKYHRIISVLIALPFTIVLVTGLLLQVRQDVEFIQPKTVKMVKIEGRNLLTFEQIQKASGVSPEVIDQVIFRPQKFHLALRLKDGRELQLHPQTGEILKSAPRLTGILIDLHQGSFFSKWGQSFIFLPAGLGVLFLLVSGLLIYPRRKNRGK